MCVVVCVEMLSVCEYNTRSVSNDIETKSLRFWVFILPLLLYINWENGFPILDQYAYASRVIGKHWDSIKHNTMNDLRTELRTRATL